MEPVFSIDDFKASFDQGARTYLFWCKLDIPNGDVKDYIYVKSSSLPSSDIDENILSYHGFDYKVHGKRSYADWGITVISDRNFRIRTALEDWMNGLSSPLNNYAKIGDKCRNQDFIGLHYDGSQSIKVSLKDAWPKSVSPIEFDYSTQDVATFEVVFSYRYHIIS